jgi:cytochrome c-type biogenesis protein CcmE
MDRAPTRPGASRRWRLYIGVAIIILVLVYLILTSTQGATVYALTIHELQESVPSIYGRGVRVGGNVDGSSITYNSTDLTLRFTLIDGDLTLPVQYQGTRPDMLRADAEVLVEGEYTPEGTFRASKLLLKCPSKYEAAATQTATK